MPLLSGKSPSSDPVVSGPSVVEVARKTGGTQGGTTLTITGSRFRATPAIRLGELICNSVTWVSETTLTCVTPAHALGVLNLSVTNPDGQSAILAEAFTYRAPWSATNAVDAVSGREHHSAMWTGKKMIVWGGRLGTCFDSGGLYDPKRLLIGLAGILELIGINPSLSSSSTQLSLGIAFIATINGKRRLHRRSINQFFRRTTMGIEIRHAARVAIVRQPFFGSDKCYRDRRPNLRQRIIGPANVPAHHFNGRLILKGDQKTIQSPLDNARYDPPIRVISSKFHLAGDKHIGRAHHVEFLI